MRKQEITKNIEVIGTKRYPPIIFTGKIQALLDRMSRSDLVYTHSLYVVLPYLFRTPTVFTLHGSLWREIKFKSGIYPRIRLKLLKLRLKIYYPRHTKFVAISQYVLEELKSRSFDISKAVIIGNLVADEFFQVGKRKEQMIPYPAMLILRKNQRGFLKAIAMVKE